MTLTKENSIVLIPCFFLIENSVLAQDEVAVFVKKLDNLNKELEKEKETVNTLKEQLAGTNLLQDEKAQLQKEVTERNRQLLELNKKIGENENKVKNLEKTLATGKSKITKLEKTIEDMETAKVEREERWKTVQDDLTEKEFVNQGLQKRIAGLEETIETKNENIKNLVRRHFCTN